MSTYYIFRSADENPNEKYDFSPFKGKIVIGTERSDADGLVAIREGKNISYESSLSDIADLTQFFARTSIPLLPVWNKTPQIAQQINDLLAVGYPLVVLDSEDESIIA